VLNIRLLGYFSVDQDDGDIGRAWTPRLQEFLAYLLIHHAEPQPRSQLAFTLWPDSSSAQSRANLRTLIHLLHQVLPCINKYLQVDHQILFWDDRAPYDFDVACFRAALASADRAGEKGEQAGCLLALEDAVRIYHGDLLPDCYADWILPERERLRQTYLDSLARLVQLFEDQRQYSRAIAYSQDILRLDPLQEAAYRSLMRLHALSGNRADVIRAYQACKRSLETELSVLPSPLTEDVFRKCLDMETVADLRSLELDLAKRL